MYQRIQSVIVMVFGIAIAFLGCDASSAQDVNHMWQRRNLRMTDPYSDVKALRPGDLLVVLINEKSGVQNKDLRFMDKLGSSDLNAAVNYGLSGGLGGAIGGASIDEQSTGARKFAGNTQYKSEREFIDRFSMTVVDKLPNGNLLISGKRSVLIEGDQKTLVVTGIVRRFDVSALNTVSSQDVANLNIRYLSNGTKGAERSFINQGWFGRKTNRWWPH